MLAIYAALEGEAAQLVIPTEDAGRLDSILTTLVSSFDTGSLKEAELALDNFKMEKGESWSNMVCRFRRLATIAAGVTGTNVPMNDHSLIRDFKKWLPADWVTGITMSLAGRDSVTFREYTNAARVWWEREPTRLVEPESPSVNFINSNSRGRSRPSYGGTPYKSSRATLSTKLAPAQGQIKEEVDGLGIAQVEEGTRGQGTSKGVPHHEVRRNAQKKGSILRKRSIWRRRSQKRIEADSQWVVMTALQTLIMETGRGPIRSKNIRKPVPWTEGDDNAHIRKPVPQGMEGDDGANCRESTICKS